MPVIVAHSTTTAANLAFTIERLSDGFVYNPPTHLFVASASYINKRVMMDEGALELVGSYTGATSLGAAVSSPGACRIRVHDQGAANRTIRIYEIVILNDNEVRVDQALSTLATLAQINDALATSIRTSVTCAELTTMPPRDATIAQMLQFLYMLSRNKITTTDSNRLIHNDNNQPLFVSDVTDDGTKFTRTQVRFN